MIDEECEAGVGMKIDRRNRNALRELPQCHILYHKSHRT
jgi:hypothetical protein